MTIFGLEFKATDLTLVDLAMKIKKRLISPVELASTCLNRIKRLNSTLNSFITVMPEEVVLAQAKQCEKSIRSNKYKGPLHGIPFSVKDLIHVKDMKFTAGSQYYSDYISKSTATVVRKLVSAGAILIGTNNLNELASGITGKNNVFGDSKNPFDTSKISGGSSGGSAVAVATGMVIFSIGTDTGGSVRVPSSLCGVVGMKPTFGTVTVSGVLPLAPSLDHVGIITRNAIDSQIIFNVIKSNSRQVVKTKSTTPTNSSPCSASRSRNNNNSSSNNNNNNNSDIRASMCAPKFPKLLYPSNHFLDVLDGEINNEFFEFLSLLRRNGKEVVDVHCSFTGDYYTSWKTVRLYEAAQVHRLKLQDNSGQLSKEVRTMLLKGSRIDHSAYLDAKRMIKKIRKKFLDIFGEDDRILLLPTTVIHAPRLRTIHVTINQKDISVRDLLLRNTIVFNSIGFPALTIPLARICESQSMLPVGLQLVGPPHRDNLVFEVGKSIESLLKKYTKHDSENLSNTKARCFSFIRQNDLRSC